MNILDGLKDIVKHTTGLGFIDMVKVIGTGTDAKVEAIDADKTVIIFGNMYQPIVGIDSTVGLSRIPVLKGFMDFPPFAVATSKTAVVKENRAGVDIPSEVKFDSGVGHVGYYRFMSETMVNDQIKVPPFRGATWDITITPDKKSVTELSLLQGVLGGFEKRFIVNVDKGTLNFSVGNGPTDRTTIPFATGVTGNLKHQWSWPLSQLLSILKLGDTASTITMNFSDQGALKIDIDSGIGQYSYILPAARS